MPFPEPATKRILVVDDDRMFRHAVITLLDSAGFRAMSVADGAAALAELHKSRFDLVILDLGLPTISGQDVLAEIQKLEWPPKVIVCTADDTPSTVLQAIRDRAHQYIVKPAPPKTIVGLVERVFAVPSRRPIEVVSGRAEWLELLVPCELEAAERIQGFIEKLDADLPQTTRDSIAQAFRELLMN